MSSRLIISFNSFVFATIAAALACYVLEAYSIGPVPLSWVSSLLSILAGFVLIVKRKALLWPPATSWLLFYIAWGLLALVIYNADHGVPQMPPRATTPYAGFVSLRLLSVLAFLGTMVASYAIARSGRFDSLVRLHGILLLIVSFSAFYIYIAQRYGFWEPPRQRMGTGGQDFIYDRVEFSYMFHRALGTFREPSHLAEWLSGAFLFLLPLIRYYFTFWVRVAIAGASILVMILTGSVLGLFCLTVGFSVLLMRNSRSTWHQAGLMILMAAIAVVAADIAFSVDFIAATAPRIGDLISGGLAATNRAYIHESLELVPLSLMGYGMGNSALLISNATGSDLVSGVLSLFLVAIYDAGVVGLLALLIVFCSPVFLALKSGSIRHPLVAGCLAAHASWMVAYLGRAPELSPAHAVIMGIFFAAVRAFRLSHEARKGLPLNDASGQSHRTRAS